MKKSTLNPGLFDTGFLDELSLDEIVPAELARWRPLVADGLAFFLQRLPAQRLMSIALAQSALPEVASTAQRLVNFLAQCPTLHKLGQVLARHRALPAELRQRLQALETLPPATPFKQMRAILFNEIPQFPRAVKLSGTALAEGSVAVVLPFTYEESGRELHGVFKILKPDVEQHFAEEMAIWLELAAFMETRGAELGLPALDYRGTLEGIPELLANEVRLDLEQRNLQAAAEFYSGEPRVMIPRLLPWCSPRVTAMERVFGCKLSDAVLAPAQSRALASILIQTLLGQPFWNQDEDALVHADLHGGNIFLADDGRVALLDWSLAVRISKRHREAMVSMAIGGLTLNADKICQSIADLDIVATDKRAMREAVERALEREVMHAEIPGFEWMLGLLDDLATRTPCSFPQDLLLFRKTWFSLAGVIRDLAGKASPDIPLLGIAARRFVGEIGSRFYGWPHSRRFATHVSNTDLAVLMASSVPTWTRYWSKLLTGLLAAK